MRKQRYRTNCFFLALFLLTRGVVEITESRVEATKDSDNTDYNYKIGAD